MPKDMQKKEFMECLSNFMSDPEGLTQEDLMADLKEQKIDVNQLKIDVAEIVKHGSEEMRLGWRRRAKQRMGEIEKLFESTKTISGATINVMDKMGEFIKVNYGLGAFKLAEAYFRNKGELSQQDIMSLLEDLEQLESLEKSDPKKDL
jgi:arginine repressor